MSICPECKQPFDGRGEHDARLGKTWCSQECKNAGKYKLRTPLTPLSVWSENNIIYIRFSDRIQGLDIDEAKKLQENLNRALSTIP